MISWLNASGAGFFAFGAIFLLQSSLFLIGCLLAARLLRKRGPIIQAYLFKLSVPALALLVVVPFFSSAPTHPIVSLPIQSARIASNSTVIAVDSALSGASLDPDSKQKQVPSPLTAQPPLAKPHIVILTFGGALLSFWILGVGIGFLSVLLGLLAVRRIHLHSDLAVDSTTLGYLETASRELSLRTPQIRLVNGSVGPCLAGILRPCIYLPKDALDEDQTEVAVLHELAHLKSKDHLWSLILSISTVLLWPQPLLWLVSKYAKQAFEEAADQQVISNGIGSREYANCLLDLVSERKGYPANMLAVAESKTSVGRRIERLFEHSAHWIRSIGPKLGLGSAACAVVLVLTCITLIACTETPFATFGKNTTAGFQTAKPWIPPASYVNGLRLPGDLHYDWKPVDLVSSDASPASAATAQGKQQLALGARDVKAVSEVNYIVQTDQVQTDAIARLLRVLAMNPGDSYAEFALAQGYRGLGQTAEANRWLLKSEADAPFLLVRRLIDSKAQPVPNFKIELSLTYSLPGKPLDMGLQDQIAGRYRVVTDDNGYFVIPALSGRFYYSGMSYFNTGPAKDAVLEDPLMDWVIPHSKLAFLPPVVLRPHVQAWVTGQEVLIDGVTRIRGTWVGFRWKPYPGADHYHVEFEEWKVEKNGRSGKEKNGSGLEHSTSRTSITLPVGSIDSMFRKDRLYTVIVAAQDSKNNEISRSKELTFQVMHASGPLTLTEKHLQLVLPLITKIAPERNLGNEIDLDAHVPLGTRLDDVQDRADVFKGYDLKDVSSRLDNGENDLIATFRYQKD